MKKMGLKSGQTKIVDFFFLSPHLWEACRAKMLLQMLWRRKQSLRVSSPNIKQIPRIQLRIIQNKILNWVARGMRETKTQDKRLKQGSLNCLLPQRHLSLEGISGGIPSLVGYMMYPLSCKPPKIAGKKTHDQSRL